jgi:hypothetical protein
MGFNPDVNRLWYTRSTSWWVFWESDNEPLSDLFPEKVFPEKGII